MASKDSDEPNKGHVDIELGCLTEVKEGHQKISLFTPNPDHVPEIPVYNFMELASEKLDKVVRRAAFMEMNMEQRMRRSPPGYGETVAIGFASSAAWTGFESALPHVVAGIGQMWEAVKSSIKS